MKALIIEDEPIIARMLQQKLGAVAPDVSVIAILGSLRTARRWFAEHAEPDLILMDIQLGDGVSFELFSSFRLQCPVIFTTAYDEYAIRAFRTNGVDYLLKPVEEDDLRRAVEKCRLIHQGRHAPPEGLQGLLAAMIRPASAPQYKEKFIVQVRNQWIPVNTRDIACFSKEWMHYLYLHSGEKYPLDCSSLEELEAMLDPRQFYRANRQFIINIDAVHSVKPVENSKLLIRLREPNEALEIDMSRLKSPDFRKWLDR